MGWKTLEQHTLPVTNESEPILPGVYHALVDGVMMGRIIRFGITNRCRHCKGTGRTKSGGRCGACKGVGYNEPTDECMHVCGCSKPVDEGLVFICMSCYMDECDYPESAYLFV